MRFSRARYVTLCQQSLVTAAVLAVGVSAAGVKTLDIVPQPAQLSGQNGSAAIGAPTQEQLSALRTTLPPPKPRKAPVVSAPVTPDVREVKVTPVEAPTKKTSVAPGEDPSSHGDASRQQAPIADASAGSAAPEQEAEEKQLAALSGAQPVRGYATVGATWSPDRDLTDDEISVEMRTKARGTWSRWVEAEYHDAHAPGAAEAGGSEERPGTDALVVGDVDLVQMRVYTADGQAPPDLKLAVIDPGAGKLADAPPAIDTAELAPDSAREQANTTTEEGHAEEDTTEDVVELSGMKVAPKPYIYSRAQWGANERLRERSAPSYGTIKAGFIHHTVNANNYSAAQVPSLLRGIYAYHTQSRGWRDIGYNFLVDRFGRTWEGRWGGVDRAVVGAHTSGYNEVSFAMSAIGNFDIASPPQVVLDAYARLFAWKLSMHNISADAARVYVKNRYMSAINGHRDAGSTACPGKYLYAKLSGIRAAARSLQNKAQTVPKPAPKPTPDPAPKPVPAPPKPAGPAYTGSSMADPRCSPSTISSRSYRYTGAKHRPGLLVPLQCLLKQQGLYRYAVTGRWNAQTVAGIRAFQVRMKHPVRSAFTRSDWVSLLSAGNSGTVLRPGKRGSDVIRVQRTLNAALGRKLAVTGTYDKRTRTAVGVYQRRVGIKATKVVASQTWGAMRVGRR